MNEEKDIIITLDDNKKYVLVDKIKFNDKVYVYLTELEDYSKYIIGELVNGEIVEVEYQNLLGQIIMEFSKKE